VLGTATHPKRVFGPPVGGRSVNIHVREVHGATARYALLFRDFLMANDVLGIATIIVASQDWEVWCETSFPLAGCSEHVAASERVWQHQGWRTTTRSVMPVGASAAGTP
jgi:hypothetical protein